ncbi:MAG: EAL domain-containing protein [Halioglobus sp.]|nr:EAL domain-containing protein [Halioglobus sp.]
MNLTAKLCLLFAATAVLIAVLLFHLVGGSAFDLRVQALANTANSVTVGHPSLAMSIRGREPDSLKGILQPLFETDLVEAIAAFDSAGRRLVSFQSPDSDIDKIPQLTQLRREASILELVLVGEGTDGVTRSPSYWSSLLGEQPAVFATVPVVASDAATRAGNRSQVVVGFLALGQSGKELSRAVLADTWPVLAIALAPLGLLAFAVLYMVQKFWGQVDDVRELAQRIRVEGLAGRLRTRASGQFGELVAAINDLIESLQRHKQEVDASSKLLSMEVDKSATELSQRESELEKAAQEISAVEDRLQQASNYDSLTGLPNRDFFTQRCRERLRLQRRNGKSLALLVVNLNNFWRVNESLGHRLGDLVLSQVAERLRGCVGHAHAVSDRDDSDLVVDIARLGGDEFGLLLSQSDEAESVRPVAERIAHTLSQPISEEGQDVVITVSIGIAVAPEDGEEVDELLRAAATAMRESRETGTDYRFFNEAMEESAVDDFRLAAELHRAIERGQLSLHYQPQVDTFDGSISGAEAFLRWEHPELGMIPPYRFIPVAEETGLIGDLGDWVITEACRQLQTFRAEGLNLPRVAVNVSARELPTRIVERVGAALAQSDLPPECLELGLSEAVLAPGNPAAARILEELGQLGVYLSLENFGTAGAPLAALERYDLKEVKIDRSFVSGCDKGKESARLVAAVIALAQGFDLQLVAEGVETPGEYRFLADRGVRSMRGYLFSKPVPAQKMRELLGFPWYYAAQLQRMAMTD